MAAPECSIARMAFELLRSRLAMAAKRNKVAFMIAERATDSSISSHFSALFLTAGTFNHLLRFLLLVVALDLALTLEQPSNGVKCVMHNHAASKCVR